MENGRRTISIGGDWRMDNGNNCPICDREANRTASPGLNISHCHRCGEFVVPFPSHFSFGDLSADQRLCLASTIRQLQIQRRQRAILNTDRDREEFKNVDGELYALSSLLKMQVPPIAERIDRTLANLARLRPLLGETFHADPSTDYSIAWCHNESEFVFLLKSLQKSGFVQILNDPASPFAAHEIQLTIPGWNRIDELQRLPKSQKARQGFIAMSFAPELAMARESGFKPAIQDADYDPMVINEIEFNTDIHDEILAEIRKSRFVVADFTGHRQNVYYEAGFADGIGLPVIYTCREDHIESAHFDIRQRNHITWREPIDLRKRLANRIGATIGPAQ